MNILEVKGIHKSYATHKALEDINLDVPQGSIFGLLGPNGAGKTTLIRIINQIIASDQGAIFINGNKLNPDHIKMIGYLPEERGLYKKMKVGDHLLYFAQLKGLSRSEAISKLKIWIEKFEIQAWWHKKVEDLSKGMQQKIQFIGTVLHEPELIILDEPFSGFDPINANIIKDEILKLRENGSTIIFSTHRMESVEELCDYIALINKSRKILDGEKRTIKQEYRTNTFIVDHESNINLDEEYQVLGQSKTEDGLIQSTVRILNGKEPNELISELIRQTQVHSFVERIPSMNDIFISTVNKENNE